jgi:hypothetical protein
MTDCTLNRVMSAKTDDLRTPSASARSVGASMERVTPHSGPGHNVSVSKMAP